MSTTPIVPAQQPGTPYDDAISRALDQQDQQQNEMLMQSMARAAGGDANAAGEAQRLGYQIGVGPDIARANMAEVRKRAALADVQERQLSFTSPILARQLTDPRFAEIAHDNLDNLSDTEKAFQWVKNTSGQVNQLLMNPSSSDVAQQWEAGKLQHEMGLLGFKAGAMSATPDDWARINEIKQRLQQIGPQRTIFGGASNMAGQMRDMGFGALTAGTLSGLATGGATALATEGLASPAVPEATTLGFRLGAGVFASQDIYRMTSGQAYLDMLDKGISQATAQSAAAGVGVINTALMMGGTKLAAAPFGKAVNAMIGEKIADQLVRPTVSRAVSNVAAQWALNSVEGGATFAGQTLVSQLGEDLAKSYDKGQLETVLSTPEGREEFAGRLADSFVNGLLLTGMVGGAGSMLHLNAELGRAEKAQRSAQFFEGLSKNAEASDVRKRNPGAYEGFIAAQAEGTPAESIYVDAGRLSDIFNQSGLEREQIERALPGVLDQVREAAPVGGDVVIPTSQFAARVAGSKLGEAMLPHMRIDPDAMSAAEAAEFQKGAQDMFQRAHEHAAAQIEGNEQFAASAKTVEANILGQLRATGTMPEDVAQTNAQFMRDLIVTQAANLGVTPEEFYQRFQPAIERAAGGKDTLSQMPLEEGSGGNSEQVSTSADGTVFEQSPKERARQRRNLEAARIQGEMVKGSGEPAASNVAAKPPARGGFDPSRLAILLNNKADFSTFAHETGHYYLTVINELANDGEAPGRYKLDMNTLLNWFGVKDLDAWNAMSLEEQRKYHEQFAYSFEKYLADGKAPSIALESVFDRFKDWMKRVYVSIRDDVNTIYRKQHGEDLPVLTGEVRQVMDRMLASDDQIRQAEAVRNMEPMFRSFEEAQEKVGMTPEAWQEYRESLAQARGTAEAELSSASLRQMQWLSNARSRILKELQKQHDALRAGVREEVAGEIGNEPLQRAAAFLKRGELRGGDGEEIQALEGHKMDAEAVKALFPDGSLGEKPDMGKLRGMTAKGGLHPDLVAQMFGFDNGEQLVRNLADARPLKDEIDARTDTRMMERYGSLNDPAAMEQAVQKALHNEARARFVAVELRHLSKATEPARVMTEAAAMTARRILADKKYSEIRPDQFAAAEARAARQAIDAMKRGDSNGAAAAKRNQLLQNALVKAATAIREEVDQRLKYLSKFDNPSKAVTKAIGADYMDRINELLAGYELSPRAAYGQDGRPLARWVADEYAKTGVMPAVSDDLIGRMGTMHWKDMTIGQTRALGDAVKSLEYIGRQRTRLQIEGKEISLDEFIHEVQQNLAGVKHADPADVRADLAHAKGLDKVAAQWVSFKSTIRSLDAALLKMEQMFQWLDAGKEAGAKESFGPMSRLFRLASNAEGKERTMRQASMKALRGLAKGLEGVDLNQALNVPELPRLDGKTGMYREELLAVALNMGNVSNKLKLLEGYNWSELQVTSAINRLLSKQEMDFVQGVWDHIGSYGNVIVELQRRQTGVTPQMIAPEMLQTQHGVFRGGYYPVVYDSFVDRTIEEKEARQVDRLFENNYAQPATSKGHTIERTGYKGPIYLSLGVIARHIDQVTHDLAWREPITEMNKALSDPRLRDEVEQTMGREYYKQFRPWLQAMANDRVFNTAGDAAWEKLYRTARSNATIVGVGFRLSTMQIHGVSALSNSIGEIGAKWFAKGVAQFVGMDRIQATRDFVFARSPEMATRMRTMDRNVQEVLNDISRHETEFGPKSAAVKIVDGARKFATYGVAMSDMASAMPTWMGAYLKGLAKEADGGLNLSEPDAVEYANRAVRNAHGGGGTKDLSALQRDKGALSLATMFYSFWNHMYNRQRDLGKGWSAAATGQVGTNNLPRLLARSWWYFVIPQLAHALLKPSAKKGGEEDGSLASFAQLTAEEIGLGFVSGVPILRDMANAAVNGRDYTITPLEQAGKSMVLAARDAKHVATGEPVSKHAFMNASQATGYTFGIPTAQPAATVHFLWDVVNGDADPESLKDWWQGTMTGKISP